jgi:hypothetical protein
MMNKVFLISLLTVCCSNPKNLQTTSEERMPDTGNQFAVYKIDSVNSYYLIYAKRKDTLYKIVSHKIYNSNCQNLYVGMSYDLKLYSIWRQPIIVGGVNMSPSANLNVNCLGFDDSTRICLERDSIMDLHMAESLQGLCLLKK